MSESAVSETKCQGNVPPAEEATSAQTPFSAQAAADFLKLIVMAIRKHPSIAQLLSEATASNGFAIDSAWEAVHP